MDNHVRTLGRLSLAYGLVGGGAAAAAFLFAGGIWGLYSLFDDPMMGVIIVTIAALHLVTAPPALLGGIFIMRFAGWARVLLTVTAALEALTFPLGTLLGAYGLWVLLSPEVEPLFEEALPDAAPYHRPGRPPGKHLMRTVTAPSPSVADKKSAQAGEI